MLDTNNQTRTISIEIECPLCWGSQRVTVPRHDGSTERGHLDPAGSTMVDIECGCSAGKAQLSIEVRDIEDLIVEYLDDTICRLTHGMLSDDRNFLRNANIRKNEARRIVARLVSKTNSEANLDCRVSALQLNT